MRISALACCLGLIVTVVPAAELGPKWLRISPQAREDVATVQLPEIDRGSLLQEDASVSMSTRFAVPIRVAWAADPTERWQVDPDGSRHWWFRFRVDGAVSLSLFFSDLRLPPGGALFLLDPDGERVRGPYTASDVGEDHRFWTPIVPGDEAVIELSVPSGSDFEPDVFVEQVFAGYRGIEALSPCNVHVACPDADGWRKEVRAAVKYTVGGTDACSGTLLADVEGTDRPFVLTAFHCGVTPSNVHSVVTYWDDQSPTCFPVNPTTGDIVTFGATWLAEWRCTDFTLLELDGLPADETDIYFAGWDRAAVFPAGGVAFHHPEATQKRISKTTYGFGQGTGRGSDPQFIDCPDDTHWLVAWTTGITQPGSSGSGVFDTQHRLVGDLSTADEDCAGSRGASFGKFYVSWDTTAWPELGGGLSTSQLSDWLDPNDTGTVRVDGRSAAQSPALCTSASEPDSSAGQVTAEGSLSRLSPDRALVKTASGFGLTWYDGRDGNDEIYFRTLDSAGVPDGSEFRITNQGAVSAYPSIAWNGANFGIAWQDNRDGNNEIYFALVSPDGVVQATQRLTFEINYSLYPKVVSNGDSFTIVWNDFRNANYEIYLQQVSSAGGLIGGNRRLTANAGQSLFPEIEYNGTDFAVAWHDSTPGNYEVYFQRFDAAGNALTSPQRVTNDAAGSEYPTLAWNGSEYGVAWQDTSDGNFEIWFAVLDVAGILTDGPYNISNNDESYAALGPSMAWGDGEYGLSWRDNRTGNYEIRFARLGRSGHQSVPQRRLSISDGTSYHQTTLWSGASFVTVWTDDTGGGEEVFSGRMGCCADTDGDAVNACSYHARENLTGGDCDDTVAATHPGAVEINDGMDNQCPGEHGHGLVDEVSGVAGFGDPSDEDTYCWPAQEGATGYEVVRATSPDLNTGCTGTSTSATCWSPSGDPAPGETFYYVVRAVAPNVGSWGADSTGTERAPSCP